MATPLKIEPVDATFGAVVTGFRIPEIDDDTFQALHAAWLKYALLIFPGQHLTRAEQIAFAKRFGPLEFEMTAISNVKEDGTLRLEKDNDDRMKILKGNMGWHADSTYMPVQAKGAVFCAKEAAFTVTTSLAPLALIRGCSPFGPGAPRTTIGWPGAPRAGMEKPQR